MLHLKYKYIWYYDMEHFLIDEGATCLFFQRFNFIPVVPGSICPKKALEPPEGPCVVLMKTSCMKCGLMIENGVRMACKAQSFVFHIPTTSHSYFTSKVSVCHQCVMTFVRMQTQMAECTNSDNGGRQELPPHFHRQMSICVDAKVSVLIWKAAGLSYFQIPFTRASHCYTSL